MNSEQPTLGLDLAVGTIGWAALQPPAPVVLAYGHFSLPARRTNEDRAYWNYRRFAYLREQVWVLLERFKPGVLAYEYPDKPRSRYAGGGHAGGGPLQEFRVMQGLGLAEGLLVAAAGELPKTRGGRMQVRLHAVSTSEAKEVATGRMNASKEQVRTDLALRLGIDLDALTEDESDAVSVALASLEMQRLRTLQKAAGG